MHQAVASQEHSCTRFCCFRPLFGNVYTCISSGNVHVCDQNCRERIYFDSHNEICRLSKKLFPFPVHGSAAGLGRPERKRGRDMSEERSSTPEPTKRLQGIPRTHILNFPSNMVLD